MTIINNISHALRNLTSIFMLLSASACGLLDDAKDEQYKGEYVTIPDAAFSAFCLANFDTNEDGRISKYEARVVRNIDCSGLEIYSLVGISAFEFITSLDCSNNHLATLDLSYNEDLYTLDCSGNELFALYIERLRQLLELDCSNNSFSNLNVGGNGALREINVESNKLTVLDISHCAVNIDLLMARQNPLDIIYISPIQSVKNYQVDGQTQLVVK